MKNKIMMASPLLNIVFGILIIIFKDSILRWAAIFLGIYIVIYSVVAIINSTIKNKNYTLLSAYIVSIIIGIAVIVCAAVIVDVIRIIIGVIMISIGIVSLVKISSDRHISNAEVFGVLASIIFIVIGSLLFINDPSLYYVVGALLIINSILDISRKSIKTKRSKDKNIIDAEVKEL